MVRVRVNEAAVFRAIQTPAMRRALVRTGEAIAERIKAQGIRVGDVDGGADEVPLPVSVYQDGPGMTTVVELSHAAGMAVQAKHGVLTKAAAELGLPSTGGTR